MAGLILEAQAPADSQANSIQMQIGIDSFAAAYDDKSLAVSASDRLRNLVEQIEHADQVGVDSFGIGEHHRREYLDSAPAVILGAAVALATRAPAPQEVHQAT